MTDNIYNLLNLDSNASLQEITNAFNKKFNEIKNMQISETDKNILIHY
jgi:hypothetical protein